MKRQTIFFTYRRSFFAAAINLFFFASTMFAGNGKITGKVFDTETHEPLPGVNVIISSVMLSDGSFVKPDHPLGVTTGVDGYYFILNVPPGVYAVTARLIGYSPVVQEKVRVDLDRTIPLDFSLTSSAIQVGQVVVTAKHEIIKQDVSATQEVIVTTRLEEMPVLRVDEFVGRVKGIQLVSGSEGNGLSVRGGAIRETDVRLDGISLQDPRSENSYLALNSTAIEEIQVLTGGFEAKYGRIRSGLLNVVTKDGSRDRYTVSLKADIAPAGQRRFFGTNPWSNDSWVYKVYAGQYAMNGIQTKQDSLDVPSDFWNFTGWKKIAAASGGKGSDNLWLDSTQRLDLWKAQHPQYTFNDKPDYYFEGAITGPFPGAGLPLIGDFAERTTFLLGFKYEDSQLAFPLGPRNDYEDWNTQLKLTTQIADNMRLSVNGLYARQNSVGGGSATTSYGGALVDASSSFAFLNSTESSVQQQAAMLAGTTGFHEMFNKSRLQFYTQDYFVGGAKFTHTLSQNSFYTLDFQAGYTSQQLSPFSMDTSRADEYVYFDVVRKAGSRIVDTLRERFYVPTYGSPNGSTNTYIDPLGFYIYGGLQRVDSSHSKVFQLKGDFTSQIGRHHQFEAGFSARLEDLFVYTGTWLQAQLSYTPDLWQYYKATPLEGGVYAQDKLEFEGMILNAGVRLDYFNPMKKGFAVGFPEPDAYKNFYNQVYINAPGAWGSYDRWTYFRNLLDNPPGWPRTPNKIQTYLSPRLGVSFPITEASKMYFNYGHFYQRPPITFSYNEAVYIGSVAVPTPELPMEKTISYEFGYEQMFLSDFVFNVAAYYKDNRNEPLARAFIDYYGDNTVIKYFPDGYSDVRGIELRLERPVGSFVTFNAMYDYMLYSGGESGLAMIYEDQLKAKVATETRPPDLYNSDPRPRANVDLNIHSPSQWGPELFGNQFLSNIFLNFFFEWKSGGRYLWNPEVADVKDRIYVDAVNYWNVDFRGSKSFNLPVGSLELVVTVKNLFNNKWLVVSNMTRPQLDAYKASLRLPFEGTGNDKWGQWKSDDNHINTGWWEAPIFLNPRQILLGLRLNF